MQIVPLTAWCQQETFGEGGKAGENTATTERHALKEQEITAQVSCKFPSSPSWRSGVLPRRRQASATQQLGQFASCVATGFSWKVEVEEAAASMSRSCRRIWKECRRLQGDWEPGKDQLWQTEFRASCADTCVNSALTVRQYNQNKSVAQAVSWCMSDSRIGQCSAAWLKHALRRP